MQRFTWILCLFLGTLIVSCNRGPKVIESDSGQSEETSAVDQFHNHTPEAKNTSMADAQHTVVVKEVLETDKYTYLLVEENGEDFWVASSKMEAEPGDTFHYRGGLLKKNFYSREYDRVFETLYLVSDIRKHVEGADYKAMDEMHVANAIADDGKINVSLAEGSVPLKELFANKEKYNGKEVQVTGKVVKVNPNIMGRNWVHIQDGSEEELDLTITTDNVVPVGHVVTMKGVIVLNKDFGAGYRYDIIMENAKLQ